MASSNVESAFANHIGKRVQRKRTRGWRMPENTVYVGRPTRWGNPFTIKQAIEDTKILGKMKLPVVRYLVGKAYRDWLEHKLANDSHFLDPLKGKDLACWCRLDKPCHADILLEFLEASTP